jgi:hypothetical protein
LRWEETWIFLVQKIKSLPKDLKVGGDLFTEDKEKFVDAPVRLKKKLKSYE